METKNYSVKAWWLDKNGSGTSDQRWSGTILEEALLIAAFEFAKEIIFAGFKNSKKITMKKWERVNMGNAPKVKVRITVLEVIDPRLEAGGTLPRIIKSYGDESIKIFQCVHFD